MWDKVDVAIFLIGLEINNGILPHIICDNSLLLGAISAVAVGDVLGREIDRTGREIEGASGLELE